MSKYVALLDRTVKAMQEALVTEFDKADVPDGVERAKLTAAALSGLVDRSKVGPHGPMIHKAVVAGLIAFHWSRGRGTPFAERMTMLAAALGASCGGFALAAFEDGDAVILSDQDKDEAVRLMLHGAEQMRKGEPRVAWPPS